MQTWQYKLIERPEEDLLTEEQFNALGANGFELVSVLDALRERTVVGRHQTYHVLRYFFKRPAPSNAKPG